MEAEAIKQNVFHDDQMDAFKYFKEKREKDKQRKRHHGPSENQPKRKHRKLACLICKMDNHRTQEHRGVTKEALDNAFKTYRAETSQVSLLRHETTKTKPEILEIEGKTIEPEIATHNQLKI